MKYKINRLDLLKMFFYCPVGWDYSPFLNCSNGCYYCFNNLNRLANKNLSSKKLSFCISKDIKKINKIISGQFDDKKILDYLIFNKYIGIFSNKTDLFQEKIDIDELLNFLDFLIEIKLPIIIQTKGTLISQNQLILNRILKLNAIFFITITTNNPQILKEIEPNTISFEDRIELVKILKQNQKYVKIGMLPFHNNYFLNDDLLRYLKEVDKSKADILHFEYLHFTQKQKKVCNQSLLKKYTPEELKEILKNYNLIKKETKIQVNCKPALLLQNNEKITEENKCCCGLQTAIKTLSGSQLLPTFRDYLSWKIQQNQDKQYFLIEWIDIDNFFNTHFNEIWNKTFYVQDFFSLEYTKKTSQLYYYLNFLGDTNSFKNIINFYWNTHYSFIWRQYPGLKYLGELYNNTDFLFIRDKYNNHKAVFDFDKTTINDTGFEEKNL